MSFRTAPKPEADARAFAIFRRDRFAVFDDRLRAQTGRERVEPYEGHLAEQVERVGFKGERQQLFLGPVIQCGHGVGGVERKHRSEPHGFAQHFGTLDFLFGQERDERLERGALAGIFVAVQQSQAEENTFLMRKPAEVGAGGVVETDLRAVVGMGAPCHVMQQARGAYEAHLFVLRARKTGAMK